jgi:hypothetical protein
LLFSLAIRFGFPAVAIWPCFISINRANLNVFKAAAITMRRTCYQRLKLGYAGFPEKIQLGKVGNALV